MLVAGALSVSLLFVLFAVVALSDKAGSLSLVVVPLAGKALLLSLVLVVVLFVGVAGAGAA